MTVHGAKMWMIAASVGVLGTACTKAETPATNKTEQPAKAAKDGPKKAADAKKSLHKHMQEHFVKADDIKAAVIAGDLKKTKAAATWLAEHEPPKALPENLLPQAKKLIAAAARLAKAEDMSAASRGAATMAAVCGQCHIDRNKTVEFGAEPEPTAAADIAKSHMARHDWAVTRMWDGVVGGSEKVYLSGAQALSDLPMLAMSLKKNKQLSDAADHFIGNVTEEAERALKADTQEARATVLGDVLSSCGNCHAMLKKGP